MKKEISPVVGNVSAIVIVLLTITILININLDFDELGYHFWSWETFSENLKQRLPFFPQDEP